MMDLDRRGSEPFVDQSLVLQDPNYGFEVLSRLNSLRVESCFTDAILCVGQEEFPCHRNVLAVSSPYFKAMFSSDLRESKEAKVCLNDISPWTMKRVIEYAYTGRLEITVDNAQDMLAAANLFQYEVIVEACCDFLSRHLHPSNCLGIEHFAHMHSCHKLESESKQFVMDNFRSVVEYDEFCELPVERLIVYISSDLIDVRTEESVYEAVIKWLQHDIDERKKFVCALMEHIRFATVDSQYLNENIADDPLVRNCEKCSSLLDDAKRYRESSAGQHGNRRRSMQAETFTPRPSTVAKEVMVTIGGINNVNYVLQSMEMYDSQKDKYVPLPDMCQPTSWCSVTALNNDIYVTGGIVDGRIVPSFWRFVSAKRVWMQLPDMVIARARHTSTGWDGRLYVVGGIQLAPEGHLKPVENVDCYNVETGQWAVVGQSPFPRKQARLVQFHQTLVELGGTQSGAPAQTMESYICDSGAVNHSGEQFVLPESIQYAQIVVLNAVFYIVWEESKKLISLDPARRMFHRLANLHYSHTHSGATVLNNKIYVTGGLVDSKPSRIVECYDSATNVWTVVKSMRQPRACHGCVTIQMN